MKVSPSCLLVDIWLSASLSSSFSNSL
uniref:Similar to EMB2733/ESP3 (EMBRYO DEFECTIVE 2733) n=1 Tax=Arundo donax TaxID=35708 RepID=A0A0A9FQ82_ARUDO